MLFLKKISLKPINIYFRFFLVILALLLSFKYPHNHVYFPYKLDVEVKSQENNSLQFFFSSNKFFNNQNTIYIDIPKSNNFQKYSTIFQFSNTKFIKVITQSKLETKNITLSNRFVQYHFNDLDSLAQNIPTNHFSKITQILFFSIFSVVFYFLLIIITYPFYLISPYMYIKILIFYKKIKKNLILNSQNKIINSKKIKILCLIFLIIGLSISSFINLKKDPGWNGDDYAQYLHQAKNFTISKPQNQTGLKYTQYVKDWGAPEYVPIGFPLILSPVYFLGGQKIIDFSIYISFLLFLTGILLYFYYLKTFNNPILSLILVFVFTFNPYIINFKTNILPEIPFILFILLTFYLYQFHFKNKISFILLISFLIGFIITIRPAGAPLVLATLLYPVFLILSKKTNKNTKISFLIPIFSILFYLIITKIIFKIPQDTYFQGSIIIQKIFSPHIYLKILNNLFFTFHEILPHFKYTLLNIIVYKTVLFSIFFGFLFKIIKKIELTEIFVIIYVLMLLYLNTGPGQGFRYLLPLLPFFIGYIYIFLNNIFFKFKIKYIFFIIILITLAINYNKIIKIYINNNLALLNQGVESPLALETFNYINQHINSNKLIICREARTLALFTNNYTHPIIPFFSDQTVENMEKKYSKIGTNYFLFDKNKPNPKEWWMEIFIKNNQNLKLIWNNERFYLYEFKQ